jgi:hypothetical protein
LIIGHGYVLQRCLNKDRFSSCLHHTFGYTLFTCSISYRMMNKLLTGSLFVAICRSNWLHSRKYGTVWYHPASYKFYLTIFILCQFQGKLTGTLPDSDAWAMCVKPADSACCVLGVRCWFYINKTFFCTIWALFCDITLMSLSYVWNCDPGTHMRYIRFSSEKRVW